MESTASKSSLSIDIRQQIDASSKAFEQAWKKGDTPSLEEFVNRVPQAGQPKLLHELLILELNNRRDDRGTPLSDAQLCALHPKLMPQIAEQLQLLRQSPLGKQTDAVAGPLPATDHAYDTIVPAPVDQFATLPPPAGASRNVPTMAHEPLMHDSGYSGSRGLHIECPHCKSAIELLSDTPYESIKCRSCGSAFNLVEPEHHTLHAPTLKKIGRFELVSRLGIGGFGTVWKARDTDLDRTVALKIPRKGQLEKAEIEQFFREARSAAQLQHPNIVPVHEVGRDGDTIFIVSDLIRGVSLADWLTSGTPSPPVIARIMTSVAGALEHAHQMGVIHRDLKPSNLLLDELGEPHVMDFGLAKREIGEVTMTIEGHILGTPAYMSPEQAGGKGHWTDRRTDIYSLGVILFQMLTGELPFRGNAQMQVHKRLTEDPPNPRTLNRFLPQDLCTICVKCLERDPNRRYSTAKELAEELGRFIRHEPILARPISAPARLARWAKRKPMVATTAALTIFLAVAGPVTALFIERQRGRLQELVVEKDNLIERSTVETARAANKITQLSGQLDVWEGRSNPWEFWPPQQDQPPRQKLVVNLLDQSGTTLAKQLQDGKYDSENTARGYMGLAIMADVRGRPSAAKDYYELARERLLILQRDNPQQPQFAQALAECHTQLARLIADGDRDLSMAQLQKAGEVYQNLAEAHEDALEYQVGWLETELTLATLAGFANGQTHLAQVDKIHQALVRQWPSDPSAVYDLACYLTGREPVLTIAASSQREAAAGGADTTSTKD